MTEIFSKDEVHGIIQVDAKNAFNNINRKVLLRNIKVLCPEIPCFVENL